MPMMMKIQGFMATCGAASDGVVEHAATQQVDIRSAKGLAFTQLDAVHLDLVSWRQA
jgi:hypothetical protein